MNDAITNDKDKDISVGHFNSKYLTSRPFYVWPNSKYSHEIQRLLKGEQVTFVASVLSPDVRNAVKFNELILNFNSPNAKVVAQVHKLLSHFRLKMWHSGESHYRCGNTYYAIGGDSMEFKINLESDEKGDSIMRNNVFEKMKYGDVPLSPYTVWKFQLLHRSKHDKYKLFRKLSDLAPKVDLELVGKGFFIEEGAEICNSDLGYAYNYYDNGI
jgi:hypothetical protein